MITFLTPKVQILFASSIIFRGIRYCDFMFSPAFFASFVIKFVFHRATLSVLGINMQPHVRLFYSDLYLMIERVAIRAESARRKATAERVSRRPSLTITTKSQRRSLDHR